MPVYLSQGAFLYNVLSRSTSQTPGIHILYLMLHVNTTLSDFGLFFSMQMNRSKINQIQQWSL